jgi:hypothetical protein
MTPDRRANSDHEPEPIPLEDVLDAYLASVDEPSSGALAEWIRRFPDYSQELTEFAAAWALMEALPPDPGNVERSTPDRAPGLPPVISDLLREKRAERDQPPRSAPAIAGLVAEAKARGLSPQKLADAADMNVALVRKLDLRLIYFGTIPTPAIEALAAALSRDVVAVAAYLQGPPKLPAAASFHADAAPAIGRLEDFFSAVRSDTTLEESRRRRWLALESRDR